MTSPPPSRGRGNDALRYAGLGIQLAVTVALLAWVGGWLDRRFGTDGVITIVLVLVGFTVMMVGLLRELRERGGRKE